MNLLPYIGTREIARIDDLVSRTNPFVAIDFLTYTIRDYAKILESPWGLYRDSHVMIHEHATSLLRMIKNQKMSPSDAVAKLSKLEAEVDEK